MWSTKTQQHLGIHFIKLATSYLRTHLKLFLRRFYAYSSVATCYLLTTPALRSSFYLWTGSNSFLVSFWPKFELSRRQRCVCAMCQTNYFFFLVLNQLWHAWHTRKINNEYNNSTLMGQADHDRFDPINNCLRKCTRNKYENTPPFLAISCHWEMARFIYTL